MVVSHLQSGMKTLAAPDSYRFQCEAKSRFIPFGEKIRKSAKVSPQVVRSTPVPSMLIRWRANVRHVGSGRLEEKIIWWPYECMKGAQLAAPLLVSGADSSGSRPSQRSPSAMAVSGPL
jgi:hypothetical protein